MHDVTEHTEREGEARKEILRLVSIKERCISDLRKRLKRNAFSEDEIAAALDWAADSGIVDERRFMEAFIQKHIISGEGQQGIEYELEKFGLDPYDLPGWPSDYFGDEEAEIIRAIALLQKKPPTARNKREAAFRRLYQKGYSSSVSSKAARIWVQDNEIM